MLTKLGEAVSAFHIRSRAMKPRTRRSPLACRGFVIDDARPDGGERKAVESECGLRRRSLLKAAAGLGPALTLPGLLGCGGGSFSTDPSVPNVVFITADDLGWNDLGCYGNPNLGTPHIDRLAREGVRFTHAFGVTSSCAPSRASFITGEYPHTHGVTGLAHIHVLRSLSPFRETLPSLLARAGFNTALEGKWHVAPYLPASLYGYRERLSGLLPEAMLIQDSSRTLDFIRRNRDHRFYLEINYMNNHRDDRGQFHFADGFPVDPDGVQVPPYLQLPDWPEVRLELARFYSQTRKMDAMLGDVLTLLDELELAENTLVLFVSDNGPPFPGSKMTLYDRGIGSPLLLRWPARIPAGTVVDDLVATIDLLPTALEAVGLEAPEGVEGKWHVAPYLPASLYGYRERLSGLLPRSSTTSRRIRTSSGTWPRVRTTARCSGRWWRGSIATWRRPATPTSVRRSRGTTIRRSTSPTRPADVAPTITQLAGITRSLAVSLRLNRGAPAGRMTASSEGHSSQRPGFHLPPDPASF
jgi:hypothetical protein